MRRTGRVRRAMQSTTHIYPGRCKVVSVLPNRRKGKIFRAMSRKKVAQVFE
jgi:acyl-coenzyme A synthetase/AMP-(fatty) acid ligase